MTVDELAKHFYDLYRIESGMECLAEFDELSDVEKMFPRMIAREVIAYYRKKVTMMQALQELFQHFDPTQYGCEDCILYHELCRKYGGPSLN